MNRARNFLEIKVRKKREDTKQSESNLTETEQVAEPKYVVQVNDLNVSYRVGDNLLMPACEHVSFVVRPGESIGILGESGAGKSTVAYAIMGLIEPPNKVTGEVIYGGRNVLTFNQNSLRKYRWNEIAMIFQAAMNSLDPIATVGKNMTELILDKHAAPNKAGAKELAKKLLDAVGLSEDVYNMYPFELSGGMKQRVIISMSLVTNPKILVLDEPTTALDTITQFSVLSTIKSLQKEGRVGTILLISHDISVQAFMVERVLIMLRGYVVEDAPVKEILESPKHPYTQVLVGFLKLEATKKTMARTSSSSNTMTQSSRKGCPFTAFCPYVMAHCRNEMPPLVTIKDGRRVACFLYGE
jgi:peptide/nickel transport system ATP-binding protein